MFSLVVEMFNEFNQPASGFLKLFILDSNNQVSDDNIVHDQLMQTCVCAHLVTNQVQNQSCNCVLSLRQTKLYISFGCKQCHGYF